MADHGWTLGYKIEVGTAIEVGVSSQVTARCTACLHDGCTTVCLTLFIAHSVMMHIEVGRCHNCGIGWAQINGNTPTQYPAREPC